MANTEIGLNKGNSGQQNNRYQPRAAQNKESNQDVKNQSQQEQKIPNNVPNNGNIEYFENIELPLGTEVRDNNGTPYMITQHLGNGNFGNTYLVNVAGQTLVLKEFCMKNARRQRNGMDAMKIDFSEATLGGVTVKPEVLNIAIDRFTREPKRVLKLLHKGKEVQVTPGQALEDARQEARQLAGNGGGVFEWGGKYHSTLTQEEKDKLNIALPCTEVFEWKGNQYFVMEKANGRNLFDYKESLIRANATIDLDCCLQIMVQLAIAVKNIHKSCIHMDLSPANVIFELNENNEVILKVIDFGLAADLEHIKRDIEAGNNQIGSVLADGCGSPGFSDLLVQPNNQVYKANPDGYYLVDIYSLGAILYYLVFFKYEGRWENQTIDRFKQEIANIHNNDNLPFPVNPGERTDDANKRRIMNGVYELIRKSTKVNIIGNDFKGRITSAKEFLSYIQKMMYQVTPDNNLWNNASGRYKLNPTKDDRNLIIPFSAKGNWSAIVEYVDGQNQPWISFNGDVIGKAGEHSLRLNMLPNNSGNERVARIILKAGYIEKEIIVTQPSMPIQETILQWVEKAMSHIEIGSLGGKHTLMFKANKEWSYNLVPAKEDWLVIEEKFNEGDVHALEVTVKKNETIERRKACVVISSEGKELKTDIVQKGKEKPVIKFKDGIRPKSTINHSDNSDNIIVIANNEWKGYVSSEGFGWLTIEQTEGNSGTHVVKFNAKANETHKTREAQIIFSCGDCRIEWWVVQDKQPDAKIEFVKGITPKHEFHDNGGQTNFAFFANYESTISFIPSEAGEWIQVEQDKFEPGNHVVILTADKNMTMDSRTADICISCKDKSITYKVAQDGMTDTPPSDKIIVKSARNLTFEAESKASQGMAFACNRDWTVEVLDNLDWIQLSDYQGKAGDRQIRVLAQKNDSAASRSAVIQIKAGVATEDIKIIQEAADEIQPLGSTELVFKANKNLTQNLSFKCTNHWTAEILTGGDWLKLGSTSGTKGKNTIRVTAQKNKSTNSRMGQVKVKCGTASVDYTINQEGMVKKKKDDNSNWITVIITVLAFLLAGGITSYVMEANKTTDYSLDVKDGPQITLAHEGDNQVVTLDASDYWEAKVIESKPEGWLEVNEAEGDKDDHDFQLSAKMNRTYEQLIATVEVVCGDKSERLKVIQGYDRVDSLNTGIEIFMKDPDRYSRINSMLDKFTNAVHVCEKFENSDVRKVVPGIFSELIFFNEDIIIGKTHKIVEFEQDSRGKIKEIVIQKLK